MSRRDRTEMELALETPARLRAVPAPSPEPMEDGASDSELLVRVGERDRAAFEELYHRYVRSIMGLALRRLRDRGRAEDAVQEIFVDVWRNADRFDESISSETTFIAMLARRRLIDKIRYSKRRLSPDSLDDVLLEPFTRADKTLEMCIEAEQAAEAMRTLRPEQQQVLRLSIVEGMSHQEISEATGLPLGTVKTHARRGLLQVRELMGLKKDLQEVKA